MSNGPTSKVKIVVNQPVFQNGPVVSWALVLLSPNNEVMVAGWINLN